MERRAALAIGLSLLILYLYQAFVIGPQKPVAPDPAKGASSSAPAASGTSAAPGTSVAPGTPAAAPVEATSPDAPRPVAVISEVTERSIVVDNGNVEAVFSNRGGRLLNWRLKRFLDNTRAPVDLIPSDLPAVQPKPLSLQLADPRLTRRSNEVIYRVRHDKDGRLDASGAPATLAFEYEDESGFHVVKEFRFEPRSYVLSVAVDVELTKKHQDATIVWGPGLGDVGAVSAGGSFFTGNYVQPPSAIYNRDGKVTRLLADKTGESPRHDGTFLFAGIDDHYFLVAAVDPGQARVEYRPVTVEGPGGQKRQFLSQSIALSGNPRPLRLFIGPKELETLRAVGINGELAYAINYGMFKWLVIPLLGALKWLYSYIQNYGWSIVALTIIINLVMFPLRHKSLVSMRKTQALQPQIKAIQDRYADLSMTDPARQKMNTEVMNLYREKGVNPAAGCVPMLLTMPVLFAFYSMLSQSIELRGADFAFWIHDLASKDPYYVTPLLMGATMFLQQWMTPTSADPTQQKMMMFMPLVLTGVFLQLPSGLAIYYLVSNLCQIGQQYITNRSIGKPPAAQPLRSAGDRRIKSAGGGKTPGAAGLK